MLFTILTLFVGCIGQDVRPGANGNHLIAFLAENKQVASRRAIRQAKRYCKKKEKKNHAINSEDFTFICEMDEKAYIRAKKAAAAAEMVGHTTTATAGENTQQQTLGTIIAAGGAIADETLGACYELEMEFQCL
jgi:hypothetical protein